MRTAIKRIEDQEIVHIYDGSPNQSEWGWPWNDASQYEHAELSTQDKRSEKLRLMRSIRDEKLAEVDIMINDLALGDRTDTAAVQTYRAALKDVTDGYKDSEDDMQGTGSLDAIADDLSNFTWPVKP